MAFAENRALFFADFGVVAVHGYDSARVTFDGPTRTAFDDMVGDTEPAMSCDVSELPRLAAGEAVTVDGVEYTVRRVELMDDGKIKRATLRAV